MRKFCISFLVVMRLAHVCHPVPTGERPSVDPDLCPIGFPLKTDANSFVLCGQCKPFADCPATHFCKLDSPPSPGYCCLRKSGSTGGIIAQTEKTAAVTEASFRKNRIVKILALPTTASARHDAVAPEENLQTVTTAAVAHILYRTTGYLHGNVSDTALSVNWPAVQPEKSTMKGQRMKNEPPEFDDTALTPFAQMLMPEIEFQLVSSEARVPQTAEEYWRTGGRVSFTSGRFHACKFHSDCFHYREPPEWCNYGRSNVVWTDRSCFCSFNATYPACVIQRRNVNILEWTFCGDYGDERCLT